MDTLYIDSKNTTLSLKHGRLVVHSQNQSQSIALKRLKQVIICKPVDINTSVLHGLAKSGISVHFYHAHSQVASVSVTPESVAHVRRRQAQYQALTDTAYNLRLVRALILYKLNRQQHWLKAMGLKHYAEQVAGVKCQMKTNRSMHYEKLLANEARAAKQVYQAMSNLVPPQFCFSGRNRLPPRDPVNAMLSLGATFLYQLAHNALSEKGMDCYAGFLHKPSAGRASLACDLVDCIRPELEQFVMTLVLNNIIQVKHFDWQRDKICELNSPGQKVWFHQWYHFGKLTEKRMRYFTHRWAKAADEYRA
ncbi:CRISPR-associated endonuclease Cas1 [Endozoicomonas sp. 2B-B]